MSATNPDPDDDFAARLAAYDVELAAGGATWGAGDPETDAGLSARLDNAKQCLHALEQLWPRQHAHETAPPATLGRFAILHELGRGGFGIVYLARDEKLGRNIALKVQRPEAIISPELRRRFLSEARIVARLRHPGIVAVHEVGEAGLRLWIAAEHVDGASLAAWLRVPHDPIPPRTAASFLLHLAQALEYSHCQGVLHRDLKPSNVLLEGKIRQFPSID